MATHHHLDAHEPASNPPPPPPLPPQSKTEEQGKIQVKTRATPQWMLDERRVVEDSPPPLGTYFFYGTLQDPGILGEILSLEARPNLRPACIRGWRIRLWGQYPVVVPDSQDRVVKGHTFDEVTEDAARKLQSYETANYRPDHCKIVSSEGDADSREQDGFVFKYIGNLVDLSDGHFDLSVWLRRMGR